MCSVISYRRVCALVLVSIGGIGPGISGAAEGSAAQSTTVLEEIVVTAERREENVQSVAVAITALTGDALADKAAVRTK
jgi:outer membrane receptor protein involved in Fe transport